MGLICDFDAPPASHLRKPRRYPPRANRRAIERDTPIVPRAVAEAVWEEASVQLKQPLPRRWIVELTHRAEEIYHHSPHFRRLVRSPGNAGLDYLWAFTRHWLKALIQRHR